MEKFDINEITQAAYDVIQINQSEFHTNDKDYNLLYSLAFNDGVIALADKIKEKILITKDPEEAADEKEQN